MGNDITPFILKMTSNEKYGEKVHIVHFEHTVVIPEDLFAQQNHYAQQTKRRIALQEGAAVIIGHRR